MARPGNPQSANTGSDQALRSSLAENLAAVLAAIGHSSDVVCREFLLGSIGQKAAILFVSGLTDQQVISEQVIAKLMELKLQEQNAGGLPQDPLRLKEQILQRVLPLSETVELTGIRQSTFAVLTGKALLLIDGLPTGIGLGTTKVPGRSIGEPQGERIVRGPHEGFVESLQTNRAILRRQILDPHFTAIDFRVGRRSPKALTVMFIKNLANPELVHEVQRRIGRIDIDYVAAAGYIEQLIEDDPWSPFPQIQSTERPDRVVGALMEGRVAILLDGSPTALVQPATLAMFMQSPDDYYERWQIASLIRVLRYLILIISLTLPSIYIALASFHHGLIPMRLAISIITGREGVPFPTLMEALIMEVTLEILREAGLRLPKQIGQAVGIVGGLVIGEAAVQAGIVSPSTVIVVSLTAISSFAFPQYALGIGIRMLRFGMMLATATLGLFGTVMGLLLICCHLVKLRSFGVDYLAPFVEIHVSDLKDLIVRVPLRFMRTRPKMNQPTDKQRS